MSPRVLAIGPLPPPINGMSKAFQLVVHELPKRGWSVDVVDLSDDDTARRVSSFSASRARNVARSVGKVWRRTASADLVYLTISQSRLGFFKDFLMLGAARATGRPTVVHMHGGNFRGFYDTLTAPERRLVRFGLSQTRIVALTDRLRADFSMLPDWQARTVAISNACDLVPRTARPAPSQPFRVLYMSNLMVQKGYRDVLEAARILGRIRPDRTYFFDFAGAFALGDDTFGSTEEMARDFTESCASLPSNVRVAWHGVVAGATKRSMFAAADAFALPTYYVNEGQPIAIIEALTSALPVITTTHRGIPETLPPVMSALTVEPQSPDQIADRLLRLSEDPVFYANQSAAAAAHAVQFRPEVHVSRLAALFDALVPRQVPDSPGTSTAS